MAGRRKATLAYCNDCEQFHRTHRHPEGEEKCPVNDKFRKNYIQYDNVPKP